MGSGLMNIISMRGIGGRPRFYTIFGFALELYPVIAPFYEKVTVCGVEQLLCTMVAMVGML